MIPSSQASRLISSGDLVAGSALGMAGSFAAAFPFLVATLVGWAWQRFREQ